MIESCYLCGRSWGVTSSPRSHVLCAACARPTPNCNPARYWWLRAHTGWDYPTYRSPEWWDQQTSLYDLRHAADTAHTITT